MLRGIMNPTRPGQFGDPLGALQTEAASGVQDFIGARETPEQFLELMGPLRDVFNRQTDLDAAQTKESLGQSGNRFSTAVPSLIGRQRGERATQLDALMSQAFLQEQGGLLQALGMLQGFGQEATRPFFDFAKMGILPEQTVVQDSPFVTGAGVLTDILKAISGLKGDSSITKG